MSEKAIIIVDKETLKPYKVTLASIVYEGCVIQSKAEFKIVDPLTDKYIDFITIENLKYYSFTNEVAIELMKLLDNEIISIKRTD
jgi:hypothetical protein